MEWTQTLLQVGEAFSGGPAAELRASLQVILHDVCLRAL
jgi:hypothetical protein